MRRPRLCFANADSGGLGIPPGPTMGACHEMAGRGAGDGGKSVVIGGPLACLLCLRRAGRGLKERRGGTLRGVAVCLCFPAIREISRGRYQGAPFGVPSPLNGEGRSTKSPTRAAARERERLAV
jgi:hypothetical protein